MLEVLYIEDNHADAHLMSKFFKKSSLRVNMHHLEDGTDALDYLRRRGAYQNAVRPSLILLDLNLPKVDGREVLKEVKADPDLGTIPIVVLTSSSREDDVVKSYQLHANSYLVKATDLKGFNSTMQAIEDFWLRFVQLPPSPSIA